MASVKKLLPGLLLVLLYLNPVSIFPCLDETKDKPDAAETEKDKTSSENKAPHHRKTWWAILEDGILITASTLDYWGS